MLTTKKRRRCGAFFARSAELLGAGGEIGLTFDELRDKAHALPLKPGVYIMQNAASEVIYVGKAKALKNRVSQYFQDQSRHNEKTRDRKSVV